ncbi:hypothetical protein ACFSTI_01575 [Rhizorhabdus histidinilytica]
MKVTAAIAKPIRLGIIARKEAGAHSSAAIAAGRVIPAVAATKQVIGQLSARQQPDDARPQRDRSEPTGEIGGLLSVETREGGRYPAQYAGRHSRQEGRSTEQRKQEGAKGPEFHEGTAAPVANLHARGFAQQGEQGNEQHAAGGEGERQHPPGA